MSIRSLVSASGAVQNVFLRRWTGTVSVRYTRCTSDWGDVTVLGTSTLPSGFWRTMQADLHDLETGKGAPDCASVIEVGHRAELSHMESPEADEALRRKIETNMYNLFNSVPLPENAMQMALARTDDELRERAAMEVVKEAVREAYHRQQRAKKVEQVRLEQAAERLKGSSARGYFASSLDCEGGQGESVQLGPPIPDRGAADLTVGGQTAIVDKDVTDNDATLLREELKQLQHRAAQIEELLRQGKT